MYTREVIILNLMETTNKTIKRIAFFGDAEATEKDEHFLAAVETAELLAKKGYIIVNGGGPGIMLAATLGAKKAKGEIEIVIIKKEKEPGNYEGTDETNVKLADRKYVTEDITERTNKLIEVADAYIIFKGGTGTLAEVGMVWELAKFEYGDHEPLIFVGKEWKEVVETIKKEMEFETIEKRVVTTVETPLQAVMAIEEAGKQI